MRITLKSLFGDDVKNLKRLFKNVAIDDDLKDILHLILGNGACNWKAILASPKVYASFNNLYVFQMKVWNNEVMKSFCENGVSCKDEVQTNLYEKLMQ